MTNHAQRDHLADGLRELAVALVDTAAEIREGMDAGRCVRLLAGCEATLRLGVESLMMIDQQELRSE